MIIYRLVCSQESARYSGSNRDGCPPGAAVAVGRRAARALRRAPARAAPAARHHAPRTPQGSPPTLAHPLATSACNSLCHQLSASESPAKIIPDVREVSRNKQTDKRCKKTLLVYVACILAYAFSK